MLILISSPFRREGEDGDNGRFDLTAIAQ